MTPMAAMSPALNFLDGASHCGHAAHDLMAGNHGIDRVAPLVARHVQVRVADAAVENLDIDFSGPGSRRVKLKGARDDWASSAA